MGKKKYQTWLGRSKQHSLNTIALILPFSTASDHLCFSQDSWEMPFCSMRLRLLRLLYLWNTDWMTYATKIYYLIVVKAVNLRSRCWQDWFLSRAGRENLFLVCFLPSFWWMPEIFGALCDTPVSASLFCWHCPWCLHPNFPYL